MSNLSCLMETTILTYVVYTKGAMLPRASTNGWEVSLLSTRRTKFESFACEFNAYAGGRVLDLACTDNGAGYMYTTQEKLPYGTSLGGSFLMV